LLEAEGIEPVLSSNSQPLVHVGGHVLTEALGENFPITWRKKTAHGCHLPKLRSLSYQGLAELDVVVNEVRHPSFL
jgi:hypothetical protein